MATGSDRGSVIVVSELCIRRPSRCGAGRAIATFACGRRRVKKQMQEEQRQRQRQREGAGASDVQRAVLPIPDRQTVGITTYDAKDPNTHYPPITPLRPPAGAPNVLVFLIDDVGFGASTAFGGPCHTPNAERLGGGRPQVHPLPHDRAVRADARGAAVRPQPSFGRDGRDHRDGDLAPGNCSLRPKNKAPLAEILKLNGYSTAQLGKCHEVPMWENSPVGPFNRWPTGSGFEYFYGFVGGEANQYYPGLFEGTTAVEPPRDARGGLHAERGSRRQGRPPGSASRRRDTRQALLHVLRARRDTRAPPCARGVVGEIQGQVRQGMGQAARGDLRAPEAAGGDSRRMPC